MFQQNDRYLKTETCPFSTCASGWWRRWGGLIVRPLESSCYDDYRCMRDGWLRDALRHAWSNCATRGRCDCGFCSNQAAAHLTWHIRSRVLSLQTTDWSNRELFIGWNKSLQPHGPLREYFGHEDEDELWSSGVPQTFFMAVFRVFFLYILLFQGSQKSSCGPVYFLHVPFFIGMVDTTLETGSGFTRYLWTKPKEQVLVYKCGQALVPSGKTFPSCRQIFFQPYFFRSWFICALTLWKRKCVCFTCYFK